MQFSKQLTVGFTHLSDWMIQDNSTNSMQRITEDSVNSYKGRYTLQCAGESLYDNAKIEIWPAKTVSHVGRTERSVAYEFRCAISPRERLHLNEYLPFIDFYLPNFFTLATGRANFPLKIVGGRSEAATDFHIFYRIPGNIVEKQVTLMPGQMLFTFEDVRDKLAQCLAAWISSGDKLWPVYELYSKSFYRRVLDRSAEFMDLAHALEAYHRTLYDGEYMTEEEYAPIETTLINLLYLRI